jgi:drug/metabolite transporter (DMT)-like permease
MQTELKYGFVIGVLMIAGLYAEYYTGVSHSLAGGSPALSGIAFLIIGIVLGMREKRMDSKEGFTYTQYLLSGVVIAFVAGVLFGGYSFFYGRFIDPDYLAKVLYEANKNLKTEHVSDADIKRNLEMINSTYSPLGQFVNGVGVTVIIGSLVSGIASFFFRRKTPDSTKGDLLV